jgi:hypothetical protein
MMLAACAEPKPEPVLASSAASPGYAERFPERLASTKKSFGDQEREAHELTQKFSGYPDELSDPDWATVIDVMKFADEEGRSQSYVDRLEETDAVARFYLDEKQTLHQKVGGAVQYAAKKKDCSEDLGGSASFALDKAMTEQLEERLHAESDAHGAIDYNEEAIGKKNVEPLRHQADAVSRASYLAFIGVVRTKVELRSMIEQLDEVKKTLDRADQDLEPRQSAGEMSDATRKKLEERRARVAESKQRIDKEVDTAKTLLEAADKHIEQMQKEYTAAFDSLLERLEEKKSAEPKTAAR